MNPAEKVILQAAFLALLAIICSCILRSTMIYQHPKSRFSVVFCTNHLEAFKRHPWYGLLVLMLVLYMHQPRPFTLVLASTTFSACHRPSPRFTQILLGPSAQAIYLSARTKTLIREESKALNAAGPPSSNFRRNILVPYICLDVAMVNESCEWLSVETSRNWLFEGLLAVGSRIVIPKGLCVKCGCLRTLQLGWGNHDALPAGQR